MTGAANNPFAVRSSPGRLNSDGTDTQNQTGTSIIAPSKFGASSASHSVNESQSTSLSSVFFWRATNCLFVLASEPSECNGSATPSRGLLRPSIMGAGTPPSFSSCHSILKPSSLGNPFSRAVELEESPAGKEQAKKDAAPKPSFLMPSRLNVATPESSTAPAAASENGNASSADQSPAPPASSASVTVPLSTSNLFTSTLTSATTTTAPAATACNFVFGQKLHERVENANHAVTEPTSNGASPTVNLFNVIAKEKSESEAAAASTNGTSKSLSEAAKELEEARAAKRKYDEVTVVTGEEDEQNALQIYGKLFTFDKVQGTWVERGRGTLRLNDKQLDDQTLQSRLVMRTQGCLRVILNTKVWSEMTIEKTSNKSIRLTAVDADQIRVFLVMASLKDTDLLYNALEWRLATLRAQQSRSPSSNKSESPGASLTLEEEGRGASLPKRRSIEQEESGDEAKKKRSE
uniref:EOG090X078K n=1 Tax=Moina brachiata TaxID=675436 RepID=A0A4Y7NJI7_9CRUS|nr:EOG090X078K [Moina brachiata]SVE93043.1 EOG090X078K [Moina brachiata]